MLKAITSKSENFGTTPRRGTLPDSLTKFEEKSLHISRNLANIVVKLTAYDDLTTTKILKINNMCNFLNTNYLYI